MIEMVQTLVTKLLSDKGFTGSFVVEYTADPQHGHLTTNAALASSKELKEKPFIIAQAIVEALRAQGLPEIADVAVAGPGFVNITLSRHYFATVVSDILKKESDYGAGTAYVGKNVLVEYTDPNPFKEFHIGHLMSNAVGESIARLYEKQGARVVRACYQGDVGPHVAKALWGLSRIAKEGDESDAAYIGRAYAYGATAYEDDEQAKKEIQAINVAVYKKDPSIVERYAWGKKISLSAFETIYARLGTAFDHYFFESDMADDGVAIVRANTPKVFEESEGAIIYRGEKMGLHTRVFINSQGLPTYEAKELALDLIAKPKKISYDTSIIVTANEQSDFFSVVLSAIGEIDPEVRKQMKHISHGLMRFAGGKMSSRKGTVVTGESLLDALRDDVLETMKDREMSDDEKQVVADKLAVGAVKYAVLRQTLGSDIIFDPKQSISLEGDSAAYLVYAYVRARSILSKAQAQHIAPKAVLPPKDLYDVERILAQFPHIVSRAAAEHAPNSISTYAIALATAFNSWYAQVPIITPDDPHTPYRLAITQAVAHVLHSALHILAIPTVPKM